MAETGSSRGHAGKRASFPIAALVGLVIWSLASVWQSVSISHSLETTIRVEASVPCLNSPDAADKKVEHVGTSDTTATDDLLKQQNEFLKLENTYLNKAVLQNAKSSRDEGLLERYKYAHDGTPDYTYQGRNESCNYEFRKRNYTTVEFIGEIGLGHRLSHMAATANIAYRLHAGLHSYWMCCGDEEIFSHLFGEEPFMWENPPPSPDLIPLHLRFKDNGFRKRHLNKPRRCLEPATQLKFQIDYLFYSQLMDRYRYKHELEAFMQEHEYHKHTVIGFHVRGGNGEKGFFAKQGRGIHNMTDFVDKTLPVIEDLSSTFTDPPLLFIATDTPSSIDLFREHLKGVMDVISYPVDFRPEEGQGVEVFWSRRIGPKDKDVCLEQQKSTMADHLLLASADVVFSSQPSSFTESTPLSIVLGRKEKKVSKPYCEFPPGENTLICFDSMKNWCLDRTSPSRVPRKNSGGKNNYPPMFFLLQEDIQD